VLGAGQGFSVAKGWACGRNAGARAEGWSPVVKGVSSPFVADSR